MYIKLNGVEVYYEKHGTKGSPVIFLHGWGNDISSFKMQIEELKKDHVVYALDFPGHGKSEEPPTGWNIPEFTDLFEEFVTELKIKNPSIVCHSFGGRVSIEYATRTQKPNLDKMVFVDAAGLIKKVNAKVLVRRYIFKTAKNAVLYIPIFEKRREEYLTELRGIFGVADYANASGVMLETLVKVTNYNQKDKLDKINVPVMLIWGSEDNATPVYQAETMNKLIPDSGLHIFEGAGHHAHIDRPIETNIIIKEFLK